MSDPQKTHSSEAAPCPICKGPMAESDTLCANCRAELEKDVMTVRAEDYPAPTRVVAEPPEEDAVSMSSPLDARLDAAVDSEIDLLPLAPPEDFSRPSGLALKGEPVVEKSAPAPVIARPSAAIRPVPAPTPVEMDMPAIELRPHQGWKYAVIAVVVVLAAGLLGALVWSLVVPPQPQSDPSAQQSVSVKP